MKVIDAAPPARFDDYFYRAAADRAQRSPDSRAYFDALVQCAGVTSDRTLNEASALAEFQRHGFFLIGVVECPLGHLLDPPQAVHRAAPILLRRITVSYRPKSDALLSPLTHPLVAVLQESEWAPRLILDGGKPFALPSGGNLAKALG